MTVSELIALYEKEGATGLKERTRRYTLARLRHHVVPLLGYQKVFDVRVAYVERLISDISHGRTAKDETIGPRKRIIVRGGAQGRLRKLLVTFGPFIRSLAGVRLWGSIPAKRHKDLPIARGRDFLRWKKSVKLGDALNELEATETNPKAVAIARLWALTGCRRDEIAALKWSEVDFKVRVPSA